MTQAPVRHRRSPRSVATAALAAIALTAPMAVTATAATATPSSTSAKTAPAKSDLREISSKAKYSTKKLGLSNGARAKARAAAAGETPPVGTTRTLIGLDDFNGVLYRKSYTLQAVGAHIEVWVADDTSFLAGDCRTQVADTTTVTRAQAEYLAAQFDDNMYPKESAAFSTPPDRDGSGNVIPGVDASGSGDKIMTLVDNIRDDNYYLGPVNAPSYIAGFFSSQFNELLDRNIMTIDAFDWQHRTGKNPPDEPTADVCTSRPTRPFTYEGTFAHEYQHLLQYYQDRAEVSWVNEGLSDFAISLTGYGDAAKTVNQKGSQNHIFCFQGFGNVQTRYNPNPRDCGGPENSLTLWGDQDYLSQAAILADYGNAWSFMLFLYDRYGLDFMSALHRDGEAQGLAGLQDTLDEFAAGTNEFDVIHDFQTATLLDKYVDSPSGVVTGIPKSRVTSKSLNSSVNLDSPRAYAADGAPANGADFVLARNANGGALKGANLTSLSFQGAASLTPEELKWTSVASPQGRDGNPALWSGNVSNLDASAVTRVTVPSSGATLSFDELHLAEATYDYAYTVVSTDGGMTYTALANENTVDAPYGPALNGDAEDWATQTFDLSAYAGKSILVGFRYVSDGGVNDGGWYVDDVTVGDTLINDGTTTEPFESTTQVRPVAVRNWTVRVVGLDAGKGRAVVRQFGANSFSLTASQLARFAGYQQVIVLVSYDEPTEQYQPPASYRLTVNGAVQPGGGLAST